MSFNKSTISISSLAGVADPRLVISGVTAAAFMSPSEMWWAARTIFIILGVM